MALTGILKTYTYSEHPTQTDEIKITYPSAEIMGAHHPDIEKANTEEIVLQPKIVENEIEHKNVYLTIINYYFYTKRINKLEKTHHLDLHYGVWDSEDDYILNPTQPNFTEDLLGRSIDIGDIEDIRVKGYDLLKLERGFQELKKH
jgi:outer membrane scaffolding protein for murein synthesis (MipA/OmpV family)